MYLFMAVPVSQLSVSPKKGKRLILVHFLKGDMPLKEGFLLSSWVTVSVIMYRCCPNWLILLVMLRADSLELVVSVVKNLVVAVILPSVVQTSPIVYPNLLRKHGQ